MGCPYAIYDGERTATVCDLYRQAHNEKELSACEKCTTANCPILHPEVLGADAIVNL